jgi:hypothetical protein
MEERLRFLGRRIVVTTAESVVLRAEAELIREQLASARRRAAANRIVAQELRVRSPRKVAA